MPDESKEFTSLEDKYLNGHPLSAADLARAEAALASDSLREQSVACGAILRNVSSSESLKEKAIIALEGLCLSYLVVDARSKTEILVALILIPSQYLLRDTLRQFAYKCSLARRFTIRVNAMLILGRLMRLGDSESERLLKLGLDVPSEEVRRNAKITLGGTLS